MNKQISIKIRHLFQIITLDVEQDDTIYAIKEKIYEKQGLPIDQHALIFANKVLNDNLTLKDYKIKKGSIIHIIEKMLGGGSSLGFNYNGMKVGKEQDSDPTAPKWRQLIQGFNVESVCRNSSCSCFNQKVIVQIGCGTFNIQLLCKLAQYRCPICQQKPQDLHTNPMLALCNYEICGEFIPEGKYDAEMLVKNGQITGQKYILYDENDNRQRSWLSLTIKTTPL